MELSLIQYATNLKRADSEGKSLSSRLRGIATVPKDFDYKEELENRYEAWKMKQIHTSKSQWISANFRVLTHKKLDLCPQGLQFLFTA